MPRTATPKKPPGKPYLPRISPSSPSTRLKREKEALESKSDAAPDTGDTSTPTPKSSPASRRWTNDEYLDLFRYVASTAGNFEAAVPGRSRNQSYQAWRCVVLPFITNALSTKDGGTARPSSSPSKPRKESKNSVKAEDDLKPDVKSDVNDENENDE